MKMLKNIWKSNIIMKEIMTTTWLSVKKLLKEIEIYCKNFSELKFNLKDQP